MRSVMGLMGISTETLLGACLWKSWGRSMEVCGIMDVWKCASPESVDKYRMPLPFLFGESNTQTSFLIRRR